LAVSGRLYFSLGKSLIAKEFWERSLTIDPEFANAHVALGTIAKENSEFELAAQHYQTAIRLAPTDSYTPPMLGEVLMILGRHKEAIEVLEKHIQTQESSSAAASTLGEAYLEVKEVEKARQLFEATHQAFPDDPRPPFNLARIYAQLGDKAKSQEYDKKFRENPHNDQKSVVEDRRKYEDLPWVRGLLVKTLWEAGQAYRGCGDLTRAEEMWLKAARLDAGHVPCRQALVDLLDTQGRHRAALRIADELCRMEPGNPDHWFNVGLLNDRLDRFDEARTALERANQLAPGNPTYRTALELLLNSR
jgi:tetratricopeptide (TPR) repeat protein